MSQPDPAQSARQITTTEQIVARLVELQDHGFIAGWRRERSRWYVCCPDERGPYYAREMAAWIEGANAMGAGA